LRLDRRRQRLLLSALFILFLAGFELVTFRQTSSLQSTFNIQPGYTYSLTTDRNPSDSISGDFQETSGNPVSFYIMTSAQYAAAQNKISFTYVYNKTDTASSTFSYTFTTQDTYYLLFDHGDGYSQTAETVHFQRTYGTTNTTAEVLGIIFLAYGLISLVFVFRMKNRDLDETPQQQPVMAPSEQSAHQHMADNVE